MISFKQFISEQEKLRQGLEHLSKLKHKDLGELLKTGKLTGTSTRKTDGAAGEVGYDENGFYTRSGRSDKVYNPGRYTSYTLAKRGPAADTTISSSYDEMHNHLQNNKNLVNYLKARHKAGQPASIKGEFFLGKLGKQTDKGVQFVGTSYNPAAMGKSGMFIMHHKLPENSTHNPEEVSKLGDDQITFDHDKSEGNGFNIDVSAEKKAHSEISPEILQSRKSEHKEAKAAEEEKLNRIKSSLETKLQSHSQNTTPRPWEVQGESEGDVYHFDNGQRVKIQSPQFKEFKQKQKEESNA